MLFIPRLGRNFALAAGCVTPAMVKQMRPETLRQQRPGLNTKPIEVALCL